ncbi:hypothetical protein GGR43_000879 [Sphingobium jiangsuense]|uniref:DUF1838 domain-containing protein n=1 Tax=Sphingobium jiangsuense TaxID=870476 RepID=A0A7W6BM86_9SPHN|nr:DUF1838 family protein [Sphingobium jiangsuense]MBB3925178.1 hypothetical protein [Sphingobium jiangsuense]
MIRSCFLAMSGLALVAAVPAAARTLDPDRPEDAVEIMKRAQCGAKDGEPAVYYWTGRVYSRVTGEPDRLLFTGEGMNIRQCATVTDAKRGKGYRQVSREVMLFTDPRTGEIVRQWTNPWTGETVEVMQIANDPVNVPAAFPYAADGKPFRLTHKRMGQWLAMPIEVPLFYHNVLAGEYQDYVGGKYHAMEIFDFVARADEILDTKSQTVSPSVSWVRISDWMPWMKMRGRQGQLVFNAVGTKLASFDALPKVLKDEIAANYPAYRQAPPTDDTRPNETTWTAFRKWIEERRKADPDSGKQAH